MKKLILLISILTFILAACAPAATSIAASSPPPSPTIPSEPGLTLAPTWTALPSIAQILTETVTLSCTSTQVSSYTVLTGDTCEKIASQFNMEVSDLLSFN